MSGCSDLTESNTDDVYYKITMLKSGGTYATIGNKSEKNYNTLVIAQYKNDLRTCIMGATKNFSAGTSNSSGLLDSGKCYFYEDLSFIDKLKGNYWSVTLYN